MSPMSPLSHEQCLQALHHANRVALQAMTLGRHPFGAVLLAPDGVTVLAEQGNIDTVNHAESTLAREAASRWSADELAQCSLVTTFEPCAMCAGTIYWAGIGRVVYGASETDLLSLTGDHPENPTLDLPCREVFSCGQRAVQVLGPFATLREELLAPHQGFWATR